MPSPDPPAPTLPSALLRLAALAALCASLFPAPAPAQAQPFAAKAPAPASRQASAKAPAPPAKPEPLAIPWAPKPPKIDGRLSPGEWDAAVEIPFALAGEEIPPGLARDASAAKVMWDADRLYVMLGSLLPPSPEQNRLAKLLYDDPAAEFEDDLVETYRIAWDTRPPDMPGMPAKTPGGFQIRIFLGWTDHSKGAAPLLFETSAGYRGLDGDERRALGLGWTPDMPMAGTASPGALVEAAIPFSQLNALYGQIPGSAGVRGRDKMERFAPPRPGEVWQLMVERRHDAKNWSAWGEPLAQFPARGGRPGAGAVRFEPPPEDKPEGSGALAEARDPLPDYFLRGYREAARQAQRESKLLVLFYTVEELAASEESAALWRHRDIGELRKVAVFAWLNPYDLPESAPRHGVRRPVEVLVLTPSGRLARRWARLPTIGELYDAVADLAERHLSS